MRKRQEYFSFEDTSSGREEVFNFSNKCTIGKEGLEYSIDFDWEI